MKTRVFTVLTFAFLFCGIANAGVVISDEFEDGVINSAVWKILTPRQDSKVEELGGNLVLSGLGYLIAKSQFNPVDNKVDITATFTLNNVNEAFIISTRSDAVVGTTTYMDNGILVAFGSTYDKEFNISKVINGQQFILKQIPWEPTYDQLSHTIRVIDDGLSITVYMDGLLAESANDNTLFTSNYIGFADRPNEGWMNNSAMIDQITISIGSNTQYTINVGKTGQGTITSTPDGIDCGATCEALFDEGTSVTLTTTPASGYTFKGWMGGCTNTTGPCVLTLNADADVFASFKPSGYALNVIKVGSGTVTSVPAGINCGTDCNETYATAGTLVTLTATPATGFALSKWTGACTGTTPTCKVTMNAAKMVTATFSTLPDFVVTGVTLTPAAPPANSTFTATVTVKNQGSVTADGGYLDVWDNSPTTQPCDAEGSEWSRIGSIAAGATKLITITGVRTVENAGSKTFRAFVDSWCQTAESQEANNQFTKVYTVK